VRKQGQKGKYYLDKHIYYSTIHYAYNYNEWKKQLSGLTDTSKAITYSDMPKGFNPEADPTADLVARRIKILDRILPIEEAAKEAGDDLWEYILLGAVNEEVSYIHMKTLKNIPCGKNAFYEMRRKFYWILAHKLGYI
jgi:hypothetical protein